MCSIKIFLHFPTDDNKLFNLKVNRTWLITRMGAIHASAARWRHCAVDNGKPQASGFPVQSRTNACRRSTTVNQRVNVHVQCHFEIAA